MNINRQFKNSVPDYTYEDSGKPRLGKGRKQEKLTDPSPIYPTYQCVAGYCEWLNCHNITKVLAKAALPVIPIMPCTKDPIYCPPSRPTYGYTCPCYR